MSSYNVIRMEHSLPSALNLKSLIRTQGENDFSVLDGIVLLEGDSVKHH